jgi:hypothetical protein
VSVALFACVGASAAPPEWKPPRTSWGEPDLQGVWTSDDSIGVPFERPHRYGNRRLLTGEEFAAREKEDQLIADSVRAGTIPQAGYWIEHQGVDAVPYDSNWTEYARHSSHQSSLIVDPEDGHFPPLTPQAANARAAAIFAARLKPRPESWEDLSMYARCITRGVLGSMLRMYMGDSRGRWEGGTLVVETTNFLAGRLGIGDNGEGVHYSENLTLEERFTRTSDSAIDYRATVNDPQTFAAPWTVEFPISREPGYQIFEYACHEGNYSMANTLRAARAEEQAAAAAK